MDCDPRDDYDSRDDERFGPIAGTISGTGHSARHSSPGPTLLALPERVAT